VKDRAVPDFPSILPRICLDKKYTRFQSMYFHSKSLSSFAAPPSGSVGLCSLKLVWFVGKSLLMVEYIYI